MTRNGVNLFKHHLPSEIPGCPSGSSRTSSPPHSRAYGKSLKLTYVLTDDSGTAIRAQGRDKLGLDIWG